MSVGTALGRSGALPPLEGAWLANVLFTVGFGVHPVPDAENRLDDVTRGTRSSTTDERQQMNKIFFSQTILDALVNEGRITLDGNILTLLPRTGPPSSWSPPTGSQPPPTTVPTRTGWSGRSSMKGTEGGEGRDLPGLGHLQRDCVPGGSGIHRRKKGTASTASPTRSCLSRFLLDSLL